jgi:glycerol-3-phosphate acyltransferase PlsY
MQLLDYSLILIAYLVGSISSAILVCRLMGLPDPRSEGSGNPGATNVLRVGGKKAAAITLIGDMLKGLLPVLAANLLGTAPLTLALTGMAAFLGHLYPVFFSFRGGKGAATAGTWLLIAKGFKISSLAALIATLLAPLYVWLILGPSPELIITTAVMTLVLFWRHRTNIQRLLRGEEGVISKKS